MTSTDLALYLYELNTELEGRIKRRREKARKRGCIDGSLFGVEFMDVSEITNCLYDFAPCLEDETVIKRFKELVLMLRNYAHAQGVIDAYECVYYDVTENCLDKVRTL